MKETNTYTAAGGSGSNADTVSAPKPLVKLNEREIREHRDTIKKLVRIQFKSSRRSLSSAYCIGKMLIRIKASLPHGKWGIWLQENTRINHRTANIWMSLAENRASVRKGICARLTITEVVALFSKPTESQIAGEALHSDAVLRISNENAQPDPEVAGAEETQLKSRFLELCKLLSLTLKDFGDEKRNRLERLVNQFNADVKTIIGSQP